MSAKLTQWDLDNFERLFTPAADTSHFSAHLIRLIREADYDNKLRLAEVYPEHVEANRLFDHSTRGTRLWRCPECGAINARKPTEQSPGWCVGCLAHSEPPLPREDSIANRKSQIAK